MILLLRSRADFCPAKLFPEARYLLRLQEKLYHRTSFVHSPGHVARDDSSACSKPVAKPIRSRKTEVVEWALRRLVLQYPLKR